MSTTNNDSAARDIEIQALHIRDYLKKNPDFFDRHPDILDHLQISHSSGNAVSLVERQVVVLRESNMEMRKRLNSLMENANENDRLFKLTRELILSILEAKNIDELCKAYNQHLKNNFGVEYASIIIFGDPALSSENCRIETQEASQNKIGALLNDNKSICGAFRKIELDYLFPNTAGSVGSAALQPIKGIVDIGIVAIGSTDPDYYHNNMGTLFLTHLADVLIRVIPTLIRETD